ncbi:hypothetical protein A2422_03775 [Candidatus Woesebacteria bacterium RIFOXYC1_FULL_31_51]|uniref:Uncharacterized protein n=1 Tax=Candidatus Woesebacteria bacterium GW2011_GWC2_31_9 TaxID=1618586 RepID=A0A0G0BKX6_9BACT|nr:MAG: hypothetical protein UR17_C0001G0347 [Candidatus Woesebacteria bacterium GW2011_GWF1_31_35]KKP23162.1 MAG: hypothetical protein UR11_C0001G0136 [Candidatus Woesebacteria bacterium GW2011_GWC1_30_29]KKP26850.1 MAG: hypothetical protein UR13_C0002G0085 [Candidatus Woesebacteria bacterium GW2011_GWD1_31_12]KKP27424.1 MAG: hypothetical protein UR16_C0003G0084 [Candidatus Woesebacteria bacterium GW2011_GWB1_31_29]KKP31692.1 MAG: hypothetical protein UR21_C0006G0007 [Candidatus Woesebacteria 
MKSSRKDIVIGFILIIALVGGIFFYKNLKTPKVLPTSTPLTIKSKIEGLFNYVIPDDLDSIELKDVTGGIYRGIAARKFEKRIFTITVLADLPDLSSNEFYEGWVFSGDKFISIGKLRIAKGGFLVDFTSNTDYSSYNKVTVTKEKVNDNKPESLILEGSF